MDGLTPDDIKRLQAPLALEDHEAREKGANKDKTKKQYLIYINQEGVIPLLNSIDPNWSWDVQNVHFEAKYVSVTGRLTIKDVARDGVGGNSPNGTASPVDEDTVKGAETDALKRAALRFGVGLYLRSTPTFWIDAELPTWKGAEAAMAEFGAWYKRTFGAPQAPPARQNGAPAQSAPKAPQNAPETQNGLSASTGTGSPNGGGSEESLFPPEIPGAKVVVLDNGTKVHTPPPVKSYVCTAVKVVPLGKGKLILLRRKTGGDPIAITGREKLVAAGYSDSEVDTWIKSAVDWTPLVPEAEVEAAFSGEAWDVGMIRRLEMAGAT